MIYAYECIYCAEPFDASRPVAERDYTQPCPHCLKSGTHTRKLANPAIRFDGPGFTRTPAIMRDPIAKGSPMQGTNWGNTSAADIGAKTGQSVDGD